MLADGLAVSKPAAAEAALEAVRATSGTFLSVTDIEIVESMRILAAGQVNVRTKRCRSSGWSTQRTS